MIYEAVKGDNEDESGKELYRYAPQHSYDHVVISTPLLEKGKTYRAYAGDRLCNKKGTGVSATGCNQSEFWKYLWGP